MGNGGIFLDRVSCRGDEQTLFNCSHRGVGIHSCTHSEDAGVMCLGNLKANTDTQNNYMTLCIMSPSYYYRYSA